MVDSPSLGFHNLPFMAHRRTVRRGFDFTVMVVGESGLGKSTLVNTLFLTDLYGARTCPSAVDRIRRTVHIDTFTVDIEEKGVKLRLTVVDTPGFGDAVDNTDSWTPIIDYVNEQYDNYFRDESGLNRKNLEDHRVHCCLYFINPSTHGLRPIDIKFMKELHQLVNIIPVIAKADTLTQKEIKALKQTIVREIQENGIQVFVPELFEDDDASNAAIKEIRNTVPFAVVGSNTLLEVNGKKIRGRVYPWGVVEVENKRHSDFLLLRDMLIRTHMQDLKDFTQDIHYENFRKKKLTRGGSPYLSGRPVEDVVESHDEAEAMKHKLLMMQAEMERLKAALGKDEGAAV